MATVYRARDPRLNRLVAVKVIHRHLRDSDEVYQRFSSEAMAVAKVRHPNIVEVYDVSVESEAERYLVVELVEGRTLRQELQARAPLPVEVAVALAIEVCRGLAQAHQAGVIHRDVKPENVLLSCAGLEDERRAQRNSDVGLEAARVKLTDFGIAKLLDAQGVTHTGQVLGSPAHMAPEQIEGAQVDARADLFSVGVLLYECLSGHLPFAGSNPAQVLKRVLDGKSTPLLQRDEKIGAVYSRIVAQALSRDPANRPASALDLEAALLAELSTLHLGSVRSIIESYLIDPVGYAEHLDARVVEELVLRGKELQKKGDYVGAAEALNRALAYRPHDAELLAKVAGLRRQGRLRTGFRFGGVFSVLACTLWLLIWLWPAPPVDPGGQLSSLSAPLQEVVVAAPQAQVNEAKELAPAAETEAKEQSSKTPRGKSIARPKSAPPIVTRAVRTPVVGPQNAQVRIDGKVVPWFRVHQLALGTHSFEFIPPDEICCETPAAKTVEIARGEGAQVVRGEIRFKNATLRFSGAEGYRASCGLGSTLAAGASREIPMDRSSRELSCKIFPPAGANEPPRAKVVVLRPGRVALLTGQ